MAPVGDARQPEGLPFVDAPPQAFPDALGSLLVSAQVEHLKQQIKQVVGEEIRAVRTSQDRIEALLTQLMHRCLDNGTTSANEASTSADHLSQKSAVTLLAARRAQVASTTSKDTDISSPECAKWASITDSIASYSSGQSPRSRRARRKSSRKASPKRPKLVQQPKRTASSLSSTRNKVLRLNEKLDNPNSCCSRSLFRKIVFNAHFDPLFGVIVALNAILIGAEISYSTRAAVPSSVFAVLSAGFALVFTIELAIRLLANYASVFFGGPERVWNMLDVLMVIIAWLEVLNATGTSIRVGVLRTVRVIRLLRVFRAARGVPELRRAIIMLLESVRGLFWMIVMLLTILYIFSIIFTMGTIDYLGTLGDLHVESKQGGGNDIATHYGTIARSAYTLFKSIMSGQSWGEVMDPLLEIHPLYGLVFLSYIAFSVLCFLNVATGITVDGAIEKATIDRALVADKALAYNEHCINNLKEVFLECDADGSNTLTYEELEDMLSDPEVFAYLDNLQVDLSDTKELFDFLDRDGDGHIDIEEYVGYLLHYVRGHSTEQASQSLARETRKMSEHLYQLDDMIKREFHKIWRWIGSA